MLTLPDDIFAPLPSFAPLFSRRVWRYVPTLVVGAILAQLLPSCACHAPSTAENRTAPRPTPVCILRRRVARLAARRSRPGRVADNETGLQPHQRAGRPFLRARLQVLQEQVHRLLT